MLSWSLEEKFKIFNDGYAAATASEAHNSEILIYFIFRKLMLHLLRLMQMFFSKSNFVNCVENLLDYVG